MIELVPGFLGYDQNRERVWNSSIIFVACKTFLMVEGVLHVL